MTIRGLMLSTIESPFLDIHSSTYYVVPRNLPPLSLTLR